MKGMTTAGMNREIIEKLQSIVDSSRVYTDAHMDKYTKGLYGAPRIRNAVNLAGSADEIKALLRSLLG